MNLLKLYPSIDYWTKKHPDKNGEKPDTFLAMADIILEADRQGVFQPEDLRGRGVYLDEDRVVFNRGDVLEVDGKITPFRSFQTRFAYKKKQALAIDLMASPLSDQEGQAVLDIVSAMGWEENEHPLYVVGFVVTSLVCGALPLRPVLQTSSAFATGKTDVNNHVIRPLQANLGIIQSNPTEAGLRQMINNDARPILIDESEMEDHRKRKQHLQLARFCFDGIGTSRGGRDGVSMIYQLRCSLAISGINATIQNPADRSRIASVKRRRVSPQEWADIKQRRSQIITTTTGVRLFRRVVSNLPTLLANIQAFTAAIQANLPEGVPARYADTYGSLFAGAHLLVSTQRLSAEQAASWLETRWAYRPDPDAGENPACQESFDCLDHLLSYSLGGPSESVRTLVDTVKTDKTSQGAQAKKAYQLLGKYGVRVDPERGLYVANGGKILDIFKATRWAEAAHKERLKDLPSATAHGEPMRFKGGGSHRCVLVPWSAVSLDSDPDDPPETEELTVTTPS
jgi:putative DNA primase/helicase